MSTLLLSIPVYFDTVPIEGIYGTTPLQMDSFMSSLAQEDISLKYAHLSYSKWMNDFNLLRVGIKYKRLALGFWNLGNSDRMFLSPDSPVNLSFAEYGFLSSLAFRTKGALGFALGLHAKGINSNGEFVYGGGVDTSLGLFMNHFSVILAYWNLVRLSTLPGLSPSVVAELRAHFSRFILGARFLRDLSLSSYLGMLYASYDFVNMGFSFSYLLNQYHVFGMGAYYDFYLSAEDMRFVRFEFSYTLGRSGLPGTWTLGMGYKF